MKKNTEEKIMLTFIIIILMMLLLAFISIFLPNLYEIYGSQSMQQIVEFIILLLITVGFIFLARKYLDNNEGDVKEKSIDKNFIQKTFGKDNLIFSNIIKTAFHLLPLYFTILIIRIDLLVEFKIVLITFCWVAFLLVELKYLLDEILDKSEYISKKLKIKNIWAILVILGLTGVAFFIGAIYIGYNLIMFYMNKF
jgi:hypothetical protein